MQTIGCCNGTKLSKRTRMANWCPSSARSWAALHWGPCPKEIRLCKRLSSPTPRLRCTKPSSQVSVGTACAWRRRQSRRTRSPTHSGARANTARIHRLDRRPSRRQHHAPAAESSSKRRPLTRIPSRRTVSESSPWTAGGRRLPGGKSGKTAPRLRRRRAKRNRPASGHAAVAVRAQDRAVILAGEPGDLTETCLSPPCRHCQWKLWNKTVADRLSLARLRPLFRPRRRRRHPSEGDGNRPPRRRRSGSAGGGAERRAPHIPCSSGMLGSWPPYRGGRIQPARRTSPTSARSVSRARAVRLPPGRSQDGSKDPEPLDGSELAAAARARTAGASSRSAWCPRTTSSVHCWTKSSEPSRLRCPVCPPLAGGPPPTSAHQPVAAGGQPRACGDTRHDFVRGMGSGGLLRSHGGRLSR